MQIKKRIKKGFTLVELVVVIAVIAILAAVSVGAYFGITDSANRSADEQAVTQMNTMLETYEILNGKVDDVEEAKDIFEDNGLTNYTPFYGKNTFYWTYDDSRVIIWEEDKGVTYPSWAVDKYKSYSESLETSADWYNLEDETKTVNFKNSFLETIGDLQEDSVIVLEENSTLDIGNEDFVNIGKVFESNNNIDNITIDLNGSTIDANTPSPDGSLYSLDVPINKTLIIENGTINANADESTQGIIALNTGSTVILRNVELNTNGSSIYTSSPAPEVIIENSVINAGSYGIGSNAKNTAEIYILIKVKNSVINASQGIYLNVKGTCEVENSTVNSDFHPISLLTGTIVAKNSEFNLTEAYEESWNTSYKKFAEDFGTFRGSNYFPAAVVTLGNYFDYSGYAEEDYHPYAGDVYATFTNCEYNTITPETAPQFSLAADYYTSVSLNYSGGNVNPSHIIQYEGISKVINNNPGTIQINGTLYDYAGNKYNA